MKKPITKLVLLLSMSIPVCLSAAEESKESQAPESETDTNTSTGANTEVEYLSQDQVTRDDYNTMSEFGIAYDECMADTSRAEVDNYNDPRHVVDVAMKQCAVKLDELNNWLTEKRFPPGFKKGYIRKISGKSVRDVMPQVMFLMSQKQEKS